MVIRLIKTLACPCAVALLAACAAPDDAGDHRSLAVEPRGVASVALVAGGSELARLRVDHVDLDRVEADRRPYGDAVAAVIHHGRQGGATLRIAGAAQSEVLLTTPADDDLSAPRWSRDGDLLAVARRSGALVVLSPRGERRTRVAGIDDAERVLGWDRRGRLLFTRQTARLARFDPDTGRVDELLPRDASGYRYDVQQVGDP